MATGENVLQVQRLVDELTAKRALEDAQIAAASAVAQVQQKGQQQVRVVQDKLQGAELLRLGKQKDDAAEAKAEAKQGGGEPIDVSTFQTQPTGEQPNKPISLTPAKASGGAFAQETLNRITGGRGEVPGTVGQLQTRTGQQRFQTPGGILSAPTRETTLTTKSNDLSPAQAGQLVLRAEQSRLAQEKQRLDQLETKTESAAENGAAILGAIAGGGLPDGTFDKWGQGLAEREGPEFARKTMRQARFKQMRDQVEFDRKLALKNRAQTSQVKNLTEMQRLLDAGDIPAAKRLAATIVPAGMQITVTDDGFMLTQGAVGNLAQRTKAEDNLFAAEHSLNSLTALQEAIEADPTLAGVVGQARRAAVRIEGIFEDVNRATRGKLDGLIDKMNIQFERDIDSGHLKNEKMIAAINDARSLSKWRRAAILITYSMVRTLRDGRPSEWDFDRLNTDFAGFSTVSEVLGKLDAMIEDIEPRVQFFRTRLKKAEDARSPFDFAEPDNASVKPEKRKRFKFDESGTLVEVK